MCCAMQERERHALGLAPTWRTERHALALFTVHKSRAFSKGTRFGKRMQRVTGKHTWIRHVQAQVDELEFAGVKLRASASSSAEVGFGDSQITRTKGGLGFR